MTDKKPTPFSIIRHRGTPDRGQLPNGEWVYKRTKIWVELPNYQGLVPVAPYDDHFIYEMPKGHLGPMYRCSCGATAVVAGYSAYKDSGSEQGLLWVCSAHSNNGTHLGQSKWI